MKFSTMRDQLVSHFNEMVKDVPRLYEVGVDKDKLWELYLSSFPEGTNTIYRKRPTHDCSACKHFIRNFGNVVKICDDKIETIWDFNTGDDKFQPVLDALSNYIKQHSIENVYVAKLKTVGVKQTYEESDSGSVITWSHFYVDIPASLRDRSSKSIGELQSDARASKEVFKRSLEEISMVAVDTVLELIADKSLYRGEEWGEVLKQFKQFKVEFDSIEDPTHRDLYAWNTSAYCGPAVSRIRNHSIGTLLQDLSDDMDIEAAVRRYEAVVAPENYKRPKEIFTKKMLEEAKSTIDTLGYASALGRRFARLDDINVNNILYSNKDEGKRIQGIDAVFEELSKKTTSTPSKFPRASEIGIEEFISTVLPNATSVEAYVENSHTNNMVSLIAPEDKNSPSMFKWDNNFSWAYSGNVTDSLKQRVKELGGNVDGDLRFSLQWNDVDDNPNDFDAHCIEPTGYELYFGNRNKQSSCGGILDVDIIHPRKGTPAVENISYATKSRMKAGTYRFFVHCYSDRGGASGFTAEIEFGGKIFRFDYPKKLYSDDKIVVADVTLNEDGTFILKEQLSSSELSKEVWNIKTNNFVPVSTVMYSPNYWDNQKGIGHKHYFFMLRGCTSPETPNGFYNEFLKEELIAHKRVFAALGSHMRVTACEDQLSGIGFSSTKRAELVVKVKNNTDEKVMKIKF